MKNSIFVSAVLIILLMQTSCRSTKDIRLFQTEDSGSHGVYIPRKPVDYTIKPNDNLFIKISTLDPDVNQIFDPGSAGTGYSSGTQQMYGDPISRYINGYKVAADSMVSVPILGDIKVAGLTLEKAEKRLKIEAEIFLKEPTVQVKFLNYKINITGEVRTPNIYYNYEGYISILDAITMANGITDFADLKNVEVKRYEQNKITTHKIDLTSNGLFNSNVFYLQPDDLVYVPPSKLKRQRDNSDIYARILSTVSTLLVAVALMLTNK